MKEILQLREAIAKLPEFVKWDEDDNHAFFAVMSDNEMSVRIAMGKKYDLIGLIEIHKNGLLNQRADIENEIEENSND